MKIKSYLIFAAAALISASCMEIDNFDAPDAKISGKLIDVTTGQPMLLDHGTTHIRIWEKSYSLNPTPQDLAVKEDGTYNNTKLFAGTYDMLPNDGAFWPCDTTYNVPIGKKGTVQDFEVTPYLHVVDFKTEFIPSNSEKMDTISFSCRLQAPVTENLPQVMMIRPMLSLNKHCGAGNHIDYYWTDTYRISIRAVWNKIGDAEGNSDKVYSIKVPVKKGYTYWCRMGVQLNDTFSSWNYSEVHKHEIPQE